MRKTLYHVKRIENKNGLCPTVRFVRGFGALKECADGDLRKGFKCWWWTGEDGNDYIADILKKEE